MGKYLLLYQGGAGMMLTEEERNAELARWGEWYGRLGAAVVDGGNPFAPAARRVLSSGAVADNTDGQMATGYTIISAGSLDQAAQMAQGCPVLASGGEVTVYETFDVM
jgi:hypothetical protein